MRLRNGVMSIFQDSLSNDHNQVSLLQKIMNCVSIRVFEGDGLPTLICQQCCMQLDQFFEFKELCKNSDSTLHHYLSKLQSASEVSEVLPMKNGVPICDGMQSVSEQCEKEAHGSTFVDISNEICKNTCTGLSEGSQKISSVDDDGNSKENINAVSPQESPECLGAYLSRNSELMDKEKLSENHSYESGIPVAQDFNPIINNFVNEAEDQIDLETSTEESNCKSSFRCKMCSKTFRKKIYLKRHEVIHSGKRPFSCNRCGSSFSRTGDLAKHLRIHERDKNLTDASMKSQDLTELDVKCDDNELTCKVCCRSFAKQYYLKQHLVVHSETSTYLCEECGKSFYRRGALTQHKATHTGLKAHSCNVCNRAFAFLGRLKEHQRLHTGIKSFLCNICGKSFSTKEGLLSHERTHSGEKPFICTICGKQFATSSNLRTHVRHHTEGKRFPCSVCGTAFFTKSGLERHARLHTGLKPFSCEVCSLTFYTKREMIRHNAYHLGNKRFSCDKCNKSYFERQHLVIHQRSHTGERPYACNWCKKSFFERSKLKRHIQTHVRNKI
ncbi:gastrula zinc finger protein XlCGF57.1 isoform X2 [Anabrus simplex]|uniref:gastrula zinc finger protein XlCGF57.1 isoform X2 n=1 Tax=Anabrus simplex TaxID=316456 RepID=UPI0035A3D08E